MKQITIDGVTYNCTPAEETKPIILNIKFEVYPKILGFMNWTQAKTACDELGGGWRLPTLEELEFIYKNKDQLNENIYNAPYWSSKTNEPCFSWCLNFLTGSKLKYNKNVHVYVLRVRTIN